MSKKTLYINIEEGVLMTKSKYYQTHEPSKLLDHMIDLREEIKTKGHKIFLNGKIKLNEKLLEKVLKI
jgi:hypothetical protein